MDGFETLKKIKEIDPQAKVLVISADIQSKSRERVLASGALDFINKPFNKERLLELLNNVLNHA